MGHEQNNKAISAEDELYDLLATEWALQQEARLRKD
jgi:hypothetical protein